MANKKTEPRTKELEMTEWIDNLTAEELLEFNQEKIYSQQTGVEA